MTTPSAAAAEAVLAHLEPTFGAWIKKDAEVSAIIAKHYAKHAPAGGASEPTREQAEAYWRDVERTGMASEFTTRTLVMTAWADGYRAAARANGDTPMQQLADQAQELGMGYDQPSGESEAGRT